MCAFSAAMANGAVISIGTVANIADSISSASQALGNIGAMVIKTCSLAGGTLSTQTVHTIAVEIALTIADMALFAAIASRAGIIKDPALGALAATAKGDRLIVLISVGAGGIACRSSLLDVGLSEFREHKEHSHQTQRQSDDFHCFAIEGNVHQSGDHCRRSQNQADQKMNGIRSGGAEYTVCDTHHYNTGNRGKGKLQNIFQLVQHRDLPFCICFLYDLSIQYKIYPFALSFQKRNHPYSVLLF